MSFLVNTDSEVRQLCAIRDLASCTHTPQMLVEVDDIYVVIYIYGVSTSCIIWIDKAFFMPPFNYAPNLQVLQLDAQQDNAIIIDVSPVDGDVTFCDNCGNIWTARRDKLFGLNAERNSQSGISPSYHRKQKTCKFKFPEVPEIVGTRKTKKICIVIRDTKSSWIIENYQLNDLLPGNCYLYDSVTVCRGHVLDEYMKPVMKFVECGDSAQFGDLVINSNLFKYLFGDEALLRKSFVTIVGLPDGQVYAGCSSTSSCKPSDGKASDTTKLVCCTNQPIVGIFAISMSAFDKERDCMVICGKYGHIIVYDSSSGTVHITETYIEESILTCEVVGEKLMFSDGSCIKSLSFNPSDNACRDMQVQTEIILDMESIVKILPLPSRHDVKASLILLNQDGCVAVVQVPVKGFKLAQTGRMSDDNNAEIIIKEMEKDTLALQAVNKRLAEQKKIMNSIAVAAALVNDKPEFQVNCQLHQNVGDNVPYTLEVIIKNCTSFMFHKGYWSFQVILNLNNVSKPRQIIKHIPLNNDLQSGDSVQMFFAIPKVSPLEMDFPLDISSTIQLNIPSEYFLETELKSSETCSHDESNCPLMMLEISKTSLDILHLLDISKRVTKSEETLPHMVWKLAKENRSFIGNLLSYSPLPFMSTTPEMLGITMRKEIIHELGSNSNIDTANFFQLILNNPVESANERIKKLEAYVAGWMVNFTLCEKAEVAFLECKCTDLFILASVRRAVLKCLQMRAATYSNNNSLNIPWSCLKAAQDLAIELKQLTTDPADIPHLLSIYKKVREDVLKKLPLL